jgi:hypothetical protein
LPGRRKVDWTRLVGEGQLEHRDSSTAVPVGDVVNDLGHGCAGNNGRLATLWSNVDFDLSASYEFGDRLGYAGDVGREIGPSKVRFPGLPVLEEFHEGRVGSGRVKGIALLDRQLAHGSIVPHGRCGWLAAGPGRDARAWEAGLPVAAALPGVLGLVLSRAERDRATSSLRCACWCPVRWRERPPRARAPASGGRDRQRRELRSGPRRTHDIGVLVLPRSCTGWAVGGRVPRSFGACVVGGPSTDEWRSGRPSTSSWSVASLGPW